MYHVLYNNGFGSISINPQDAGTIGQQIAQYFLSRAGSRRNDEEARGQLQIAAIEVARQVFNAIDCTQPQTYWVNVIEAIIQEFNRLCTSLATRSVRNSCQNIVREQQVWKQYAVNYFNDRCPGGVTSPGGGAGPQPTPGGGAGPQPTPGSGADDSILTQTVTVGGFELPVVPIAIIFIGLILFMKD